MRKCNTQMLSNHCKFKKCQRQYLLYCRSACNKWNKFISLGIHAVIFWPHAKFKCAYFVLQIHWGCLEKEEFCFINMRFAWSKKFTSYNMFCKRECLACFLLIDYHCLALELWTMASCSLSHLSWSLQTVTMIAVLYI